MKRLRIAQCAWWLVAASATVAHAQVPPDARLAAAESLLTVGQYADARRVAERFTRATPADPRGWILLGRSLILPPTTSNLPRVQAIIALRRALRAEPGNAEALYWLARAGMLEGGADGEAVASDALRSLLADHPLYADAWDRWLVLYRSGRERERMRTILARHDSLPEVRARVARLLIEDERYVEADAILQGLLTLDGTQPDWLALRAQSAYEAGDTQAGWAHYAGALAHADRGAQVLWAQAVGIATPDEIRAWPHVAPESRGAFLRQFWARRNPDLFASVNPRIAEHFERWRRARREFPLQHPLDAYQRSAGGRALEAAPSIGEQLFYQRCEARENSADAVRQADVSGSMASNLFGRDWNPLYRRSAADSLGLHAPGSLYLDPEVVGLLSIPHARDIRDVDTTAARIGYSLATGLDDRGLMVLRWGAPRRRVIGSLNAEDQFCAIHDLERWEYDDLGVVRFLRPNAIDVGLRGGARSTGDMIFRPMQGAQWEATALGLTRDASSVAAPLEFGFWTVQFAAPDDPGTDVVVVTTRGWAAATLGLSSSDSGLGVRDSTGIVRLHGVRGPATLLVQASEHDSLGRQTVGLVVRGFVGETASDLLLARAWSGGEVTREAMLAHVSRALAYPAGTGLRAYAELYGLSPVAGRVRYRAIYQVVRTAHPDADVRRDSLQDAITLAFDRDVTAAWGTVAEWLDIAPEGLPAGRYLLRLDTRSTDGRRIGRSQITFSISAR